MRSRKTSGITESEILIGEERRTPSGCEWDPETQRR
nr:MAG TPA: hypothetical protein [Caudoviricetes sp.]